VGSHVRGFLDVAVAHLEPEEFADLVERLGQPRPPLPLGLDTIQALDGADVTGLAAEFPVVAHVLHLVDLMLRDDRDLDWVAAYSAFEAINHDLRNRELDGVEQGWWARSERSDFTGTANSVEALGARAIAEGVPWRGLLATGQVRARVEGRGCEDSAGDVALLPYTAAARRGRRR